MPTWIATARFYRELDRLTPRQRALFAVAVAHFVADLKARQGFRPGLRIKRVRGTADVWEMTWAPDGRATWKYGTAVKSGEAHVVWLHIGTHDIFDDPQ